MVPLSREPQSNTVLKENFRVVEDESNEEIEISEALYVPAEESVLLKIRPSYLYGTTCTAEFSGVKYLEGGTTIDAAETATLARALPWSVYGASVDSIRLYDAGGTIIMRPNEYENFTAEVTVVNSSKNQQTKTLKLYKNNNITDPFWSEEIIIDGDSSEVIRIDLNGMDWGKYDYFNAKVV